MKLDSARELKLQLGPRMLRAVARTATARSAGTALAAQPLDEVDPTIRSLGIGIAPRARGQYRIAVRVQREAYLDSPHVERIRRAARGEVDVRFIGRIVK